MRNLKIIGIVLLIALTATSTFAQRRKIEKADNAFNTGRYFEAIDLYKFAYGKVDDKKQENELIFQTALCYRYIDEVRQAKIWFNKAIRRGIENPLAYLYHADALLASEEYEEAKQNYQEYKKLVPDDNRATKGIESCDFAIKATEEPTRHKVTPMYFFNTRESDFAPCYGRDDYSVVYFTTATEGTTGNEINPVTGQYYADIYQSRVDRKGEWSDPTPLGETINTEFDEGAPCTNEKANTLYFTSIRENKDGDMVTQIYQSKKSGIDWGEAQLVQVFESDSIMVAHPAISSDELQLFFVSDKSGGQGQKDIWVTKRESPTGSWGAPENLGPQINTKGNDVFPYMHKDGTLYFASDGHIGMGGLDLFMARKVGSQWEVTNMGYPMNSPRDDFGIVFERELERGYMSSNRDASKGMDDVFQFALPPIEFKLLLTVKNEKTAEIIPDASINLIGSDGTNEIKTSEADGTLNFELNPNTDYRIIGRKGGFLAGKEKLSTKGFTESQELELDLFLPPNDEPRLVKVFYDFGKWDLKPESMVALEELVQILRDDNPNITIELSSHTDFRGSAEANQELSEKRAKSVVEFLILYGIDAERLTFVGYGEERPKEITPREAEEYSKMPDYDFLKAGTVLTESYIKNLPTEQMKEIAHSLNRRTEFRVTGTDYVPRIRRRNK
ncbi:MAG: OmpA family protein [Salinivirgaceae bacterium]